MTCPSCGGPWLAEGDPRGRLAVQHRVACPLLVAEDATQATDAERRRSRKRTATPVERLLLATLGHVLPEGALTLVSWPTPGLRHRAWPDLQ